MANSGRSEWYAPYLRSLIGFVKLRLILDLGAFTMVRGILQSLAKVIGLVCGLLAATQAASAASFRNGWQYTIDPSYDSLAGDGQGGIIVGGTIYEFYGMAIKVTDTEVWVAINSNLPLTGNTNPDAADGNIGYGDLFFDFSGTNSFVSAQGNANFFGVRFSETNDSGAPNIGVYQGVAGTSVAPTNNGWSNLYNNNINGVLPRRGLDAWSGDLPWNHSYFGPAWTNPGSYAQPATLLPNSIAPGTGTQVGTVTQRGVPELLAEGYDPNFFFQQGTQTVGFSFQKPAEFQGNFVATLISECVNDVMSSLGYVPPPPPPPPPSTICPVLLGQQYALQPTRVEGNTKIFENTLSHLWYDPPTAMEMTYETTDNSLITAIEGFPCGVDPDNTFTVEVGGLIFGSDFGPIGAGGSQKTLNFADYINDPVLKDVLVFGPDGTVGVRGLTVSDISLPLDWQPVIGGIPNPPPPFQLQLAFDQEIASFTITSEAVPEPTTIFGSLLAGGSLLAAARRRKQQ